MCSPDYRVVLDRNQDKGHYIGSGFLQVYLETHPIEFVELLGPGGPPQDVD